MIYRSDDLPQSVPLSVLQFAQNQFEGNRKTQTMCILASQLSKRPDFVEFVNNNTHIDLALHGWIHDNYSLLPEDTIKEHLHSSLEAFDYYFNKYPDVWYLPWNGWVKGKGFDLVPRVRKIAKAFGLEVNEIAESIGSVVNKGVITDVVYFHLWDQAETQLLPKLLEMS